jgi:hypothetical protein
VATLLGGFNLKRLLRPNADIKSAPQRWRKTLRELERQLPFEKGDARAEAFADGVRVIDRFAANHGGEDRCYRAGLALLKRAERMAEALVDSSGR